MNGAAPAWAHRWLVAAAVYNLAWGTFVVLFPLAVFDWTGLPRPIYPSIWQCVGMIVGVYGIGYAIAATDPLHHWPMISWTVAPDGTANHASVAVAAVATTTANRSFMPYLPSLDAVHRSTP